MNRINRRALIAALGVAVVPSVASAQKVSLPEVSLDEATATPIGTPPAKLSVYTGDEDDFWVAPWNIGDHYLELGGAIIQRFRGSENHGYRLSDDGVVVRNVFFLKGSLSAFYVGTNIDISTFDTAKALKVKGFYGGEASRETGYAAPILLAFEIEKGA